MKLIHLTLIGAAATGALVALGSSPVSAKPPPQARAMPTQAPRLPDYVLDAPLRTLDGKDVKLRDVTGKTTVVALWGSFCPPCIAELPYLEELHRTYRGKDGVRIIALGLDQPEVASTFVRKLGLTLPVYVDKEMRLTRYLADPSAPVGPAGEFSIPALPLTAYLGPQHQVARSFGFAPTKTKTAYVADQRRHITRALEGRLSDADFPAPE
jgi:thiol-disulfide isomerase/thioredoxin